MSSCWWRTLRLEHQGRCERAGYVAKVDIKILELGGPVAADDAFHTRTDSPAHLQGATAGARRERGNGRAIDPLRAGDVVAADGVGDTDFAVGQTARRVDEECRRNGAADTAPNRSKPVEISARVLVTGKAGTLNGVVSPMCPTAQALFRTVAVPPAQTALPLPACPVPWMSASRPNTHLSRCQLYPIWPPPTTPSILNLLLAEFRVLLSPGSVNVSVLFELPQL